MAQRVNVYADFAFQIDVQTRNAGGVLVTPSAGAVTGIKLRLATTATGSAINAAVNDLAASETTTAARFAYVMDTALLQTHILPLGHGSNFYAIWSKAGDMDMEAVRFVVGAGHIN